MTRIAELERIAANAVRPSGSYSLVMVADVTPGGRLASGHPSGIGVVSRYGPAWFDGLRKSAPIALFESQKDARALFRILNGEAPTPRPAHAIPAAELPGGREPDRGPIEPAVPGSPTPAAAAGHSPRPTSDPTALASEPGTCPQCGGPMPRAGQGQRRLTCSDRCRTARARGQRAAGDADPAPGTTTPIVTASRARSATSRPAGHFVAAPSRSGSAEGPADPGAGQTELGF